MEEVYGLDGGNSVDVLSALNNGQHIAYYCGHGVSSNWETFFDYYIPQLTNDRQLPAIFSLACLTGRFDHPEKDSFAETFD